MIQEGVTAALSLIPQNVLKCMCGSTGGDRGSGPPPGKSQKYSFFSNTGPDPLKIVKLSCQQSILGHFRHASETPFKWRFAGGPMMAHLSLFLDHSSPYQLKKQQKNVKVGPPLTKLSGSAHVVIILTQTAIRACDKCFTNIDW